MGQLLHGSAKTTHAVRKAMQRSTASIAELAEKYDLNPIEQVFAKFKALLRRARARSVDAVREAIPHLLTRFDQQECANHLKNSGYASI